MMLFRCSIVSAPFLVSLQIFTLTVAPEYINLDTSKLEGILHLCLRQTLRDVKSKIENQFLFI